MSNSPLQSSGLGTAGQLLGLANHTSALRLTSGICCATGPVHSAVSSRPPPWRTAADRGWEG
eukprot:2435621-Lingulodinium_polyedra.AAC.1